MKARITTVMAILLCTVLLLPSGAVAAGEENIGGQAGYHVYYTRRTITYPPSPGAEVAFLKYSSGTLSLGAHNCAGLLYTPHVMVTGSWSTVYTTSTPQTFCMYSSSASVDWNGDLAWD